MPKKSLDDIAADIEPYAYVGSAIGNAFFSGVSFKQLWECVCTAKSTEELDAAITAISDLNDIVNGE